MRASHKRAYFDAAVRAVPRCALVWRALPVPVPPVSGSGIILRVFRTPSRR